MATIPTGTAAGDDQQAGAAAWPWRNTPRTDTGRDIARRRRELWEALRDVDDLAEAGERHDG